MFTQERAHQLRADPKFSGLTGRSKTVAVIKALKTQWALLPSEQKEAYKQQAAKAHQAYKQQYAVYLQQRHPTDAILERKIWELKKIYKPKRNLNRTCRDANLPVRPPSANLLFISAVYKATAEEQIQLIGQSLERGSFSSNSANIATICDAWKRAAPEVKAPYLEVAARLKEQYTKDRAVYEATYKLKSFRAKLRRILDNTARDLKQVKAESREKKAKRRINASRKRKKISLISETNQRKKMERRAALEAKIQAKAERDQLKRDFEAMRRDMKRVRIEIKLQEYAKKVEALQQSLKALDVKGGAKVKNTGSIKRKKESLNLNIEIAP